MSKLPPYLIPTWLRELKPEHLEKVYGLLQTLLVAASVLPNTPEKEEYVRLLELKFQAAEQVFLEALNRK